jgi:nicotinate-nucleotide adenylyltransferase
MKHRPRRAWNGYQVKSASSAIIVDMPKRLAIFGGTFDPIHIGHLAIAEDACWALGADQVVFVPARQQPLKQAQTPGAAAAQRLRMVELAVADNPRFAVWDGEVRRGGVSYTVDTVVQIQHASPDADLYFVLGADAVTLLPRWHRIERLIMLCRFAVLRRPGAALALDPLIETLPMLHDRIKVIDGPLLTISATDVRQRLLRKQPVRYHLPPAVWHYIEQHGLYRATTNDQ